jgi:predicted PurR-regulated permease PerM
VLRRVHRVVEAREVRDAERLVARVTRELSLDAAQKEQLGKIVAEFQPVVQQLRSLASALPGMGDQAGAGVARLQRLSDRAGLGIDVAEQIRNTLTAIADRIPQFTTNVVDVGFTVVRQVTTFIIIVVLSIYMLLDGRRIGAFIARRFPTHSEADGREYVRSAKTAVVDYVKAQVLLSTVMGASVGLAMYILSLVGAFPSGARYALFFGVWAAFMEAIPYLGPVLAAVPPSVVAVFDSPLSALWVIITFILIQEVEGHILIPVIMGSRFRVHPLVVIFAILAGGEIHGITGMLIAIPLIPLVKETWLFFRPRLQFEGWCAAVTGDCGDGGACPADPIAGSPVDDAAAAAD